VDIAEQENKTEAIILLGGKVPEKQFSSKGSPNSRPTNSLDVFPEAINEVSKSNVK
jgi:hypothetical protein